MMVLENVVGVVTLDAAVVTASAVEIEALVTAT